MTNEGNDMKFKKNIKYEFRYEVASERKKIDGYTLIPKSNKESHPQHMSEHQLLQSIQRHALKEEYGDVERLLLEFPEFKRDDIKKMLIKSVADRGKTFIV